MKNSIFLMLVLLHITSQPAQPSIASDALVAHNAFKDRAPTWPFEYYEARMAKKYGFDINLRGRYGLSAIRSMVKVHTGDLQTMTLCRGNGAQEKFDIDVHDKHGATTIWGLVQTGDLEMVKCFLDHGANVHQTGRNSGLPLLHSPIGSNDREMAAMLIKYRADVNYQNKSEYTPLSHAVNDNFSGMVMLLIDCGADVHHKKKHGGTCLHAMVNRDTTVAQLLLEAGVDVNLQDRRGNTPLSIARQMKHYDIVQLLLNYGAEVKDPTQLYDKCRDKWITVSGMPNNYASTKTFTEEVRRKKEEWKMVAINAITSHYKQSQWPGSDIAKLIGEFVIDDSLYQPERLSGPTRSDLLAAHIVFTEKRKNREIKNKPKAVAVVRMPASLMFLGQ